MRSEDMIDGQRTSVGLRLSSRRDALIVRCYLYQRSWMPLVGVLCQFRPKLLVSILVPFSTPLQAEAGS